MTGPLVWPGTRRCFFEDGLWFGCTRCGACCTGEPGIVYVSPGEASRMAEFWTSTGRARGRMLDRSRTANTVRGAEDGRFIFSRRLRRLSEAHPVRATSRAGSEMRSPRMGKVRPGARGGFRPPVHLGGDIGLVHALPGLPKVADIIYTGDQDEKGQAGAAHAAVPKPSVLRAPGEGKTQLHDVARCASVPQPPTVAKGHHKGRHTQGDRRPPLLLREHTIKQMVRLVITAGYTRQDRDKSNPSPSPSGQPDCRSSTSAREPRVQLHPKLACDQHTRRVAQITRATCGGLPFGQTVDPLKWTPTSSHVLRDYHRLGEEVGKRCLGKDL
jgi:hypothetical protein